MEDKVATLKARENNAPMNGDDANSECFSDEKDAVMHDAKKKKEKFQSWNQTNFWKYIDSLLVEVCSQEQGNLTLEQHKQKLDE